MILGRLVGGALDVVVFGLLAALALGAAAQALGPWGVGAIAVALLLGAAGYLVWEALRQNSLAEHAGRLDRELGLHDRISSAFAFARAPRRSEFMSAHLRETAAFLERAGEPRVRVPWPARARSFGLFLALALVALLPHADRSQVEARGNLDERLERTRAVQGLVRELSELRSQVERKGLPKLAKAVARAEEAMREELRILDPEPPPEPQAAPQDPGAAEDTLQSARDADARAGSEGGAGNVDGAVRVSRLGAYKPVGKFDAFPEAAYAEVFAELDENFSDLDLGEAEMERMSDYLGDMSGRVGNMGMKDDSQSASMGGQMAAPNGKELMENPGFDPFGSNVRSLHHKAFAEFLRRYASHLGDRAAGRAATRANREAQAGKATAFDPASAAPPEDGELALKAVTDKPAGSELKGSPDQLAKLSRMAAGGGKLTGSESAGDKTAVRGTGTRLGGQGAGVGSAAGGQGEGPAVLPRATGGEYLPLEGKLGDGRSVLQVIDARGRRHLGPAAVGDGSQTTTWSDVFGAYARGAEAELNSEAVPLDLRDYVRDYFRAIRPEPAPAADTERSN
ncbi:MAG TPA: hypothetical protein P5076_08025 [Myxococcota bacterium]|nr:hypothetical protein [Myxococcota bacterium]